MKSSGSNIMIALAAAVISLLMDQASKYYITDMLALPLHGAKQVFPGFVTFVHSKNCGINFGLFADCSVLPRLILIAIAIAASIAVLIWAARRHKDGFFALSAGLIVGGALGNAVDRIVLGAVTDFLNVTCCGINNPFAFNIADVWIFFGVVILLFSTAGDDARTA